MCGSKRAARTISRWSRPGRTRRLTMPVDRRRRSAPSATRLGRCSARFTTSGSIARSIDPAYFPYFSSTARQAGLSSRRRAWKQRSTASSLPTTSLHSFAASGRQLRWSSGVPRGVRNGGRGIGGLVLPGSWAWLGVTQDSIRSESSTSERVIDSPLPPSGLLRLSGVARELSGRRRTREIARLRAFPGDKFVFHLDVEAHQPFLSLACTGFGLRGALFEHTVAFLHLLELLQGAHEQCLDAVLGGVDRVGNLADQIERRLAFARQLTVTSRGVLRGLLAASDTQDVLRTRKTARPGGLTK